MKTSPLLRRAAVSIVACGFLGAGASVAAADKKNDFESLKKQIDGLAAGQAAIQKQLEEIRALLIERPVAAAPAPAPVPQKPAMDVAPGTLVDIAGMPAKGASNAKLTIVEFSDFECPFCGRFFRDTLPQIQKAYVDTGKLRYVFRNLPLEPIHPHAFPAHVAAMCAADQGKYWEMHDRLFQNQRALDNDALLGHAKAVGLDPASFQQCVGSGKHDAKIRADMAEAEALGVNGTPAFFIGTPSPDGAKVRAVKLISGAHPYAVFKATLDSLLAAQ